MSALGRGTRSLATRTAAARLYTNSSASQYGRTAASSSCISSYKSASTPSHCSSLFSFLTQSPVATLNQSYISLSSISRFQPPLLRQFHSQAQLHKQAKSKDDVKDSPRAEPAGETSGGKESSEKSSGENSEQKGEKEEGREKQEGKKDAPPPPPHGDKSPWQVFTETLQNEFKASKEWNEGTKALASGAKDFTESEAVRKARSAYGTASEVASTTTAKALKGTGKVIGQSAAWTWDTLPVKGIRAGVNITGSGLEKITRPVRQTDAYKSVRDVIDDGSSSRYGGWTEKEQRRLNREKREMQEAAQSGRPMRRAEKIEEDLEAGTNVTLHKDAVWKESWREFRDKSKLMQGIFSMKSAYNESENPLISTARSISDRVAGFFAENETAMVIKKFREMDPNFQLEPFLQDMREYILPEVLDAYVKGDVVVLKEWLSAAQFQVYSALMHQYTTAGLKSDGRILDIRNVDVLNARILDPGDIPVFILTCRTQEVHTYRNAKTGELAAGMEDRVQQVTYAIGVTRLPEEVLNPETRGWRLIELQKSGRDYI